MYPGKWYVQQSEKNERARARRNIISTCTKGNFEERFDERNYPIQGVYYIGGIGLTGKRKLAELFRLNAEWSSFSDK